MDYFDNKIEDLRHHRNTLIQVDISKKHIINIHNVMRVIISLHLFYILLDKNYYLSYICDIQLINGLQ